MLRPRRPNRADQARRGPSGRPLAGISCFVPELVPNSDRRVPNCAASFARLFRDFPNEAPDCHSSTRRSDLPEPGAGLFRGRFVMGRRSPKRSAYTARAQMRAWQQRPCIPRLQIMVECLCDKIGPTTALRHSAVLKVWWPEASMPVCLPAQATLPCPVWTALSRHMHLPRLSRDGRVDPFGDGKVWRTHPPIRCAIRHPRAITERPSAIGPFFA